MKIIFENQNRIIYHDPSLDCLHVEWLPATADMEKKDWENEIHTTKAVSLEYKPSRFLLDQRQLLFVLPPDLLMWTAQQLNPLWIQLGVKKVGVLLSQEFITKVAMKLMAEDTEELEIPNQFKTNYFADLESAKKWLAK